MNSWCRILALLMAGLACVSASVRAEAPEVSAPPALDYASLCKAKAASDDPVSQARALLTGKIGLFPQPQQAIDQLTALAQEEDSFSAAAQMRLARIYQQGKWVDTDETQALHYAQAAYKRRPEYASHFLGDYYLRRAQPRQSQRYYHQAAQLGSASAYVKLILLKQQFPARLPEISTQRLWQQAREQLLQQLAKGQCGDLGRFARLMDRLGASEMTAQRWLIAASEAGQGEASFRLTIQTGGTEAGYRKAAQQGYIPAYHALALHWLTESPHDTENQARAIDYLEQAASAGHQPAILALARQIPPAQQPEAVLSYLQHATNLPNVLPEIPYELGVAYQQRNRGEDAFTAFQQAAELGQRGAILKLGEAYQYGQGVTANPVHSYRYYRQAARLGSHRALKRLVENYRCGVGELHSVELATQWRKRGLYEGVDRYLLEENHAAEAKELPREINPALLRQAIQEQQNPKTRHKTEAPSLDIALLQGDIGAIMRFIRHGSPRSEAEYKRFFEQLEQAKRYVECEPTKLAELQQIERTHLYRAGGEFLQNARVNWQQMAEAGSPQAMLWLAQDKMRRQPHKAAREEALSLYRSAAEAGSIPAMLYLGRMAFIQPQLTERTAQHWWHQAAEAGSEEAFVLLDIMQD